MANLVALQLDKDTGRIVAKDRNQGPGGSDLPDGCFQMCGFAFLQAIASDVWLIIHNTGLSKGIVQIYDTSNELVIPDAVDFLDANTIVVTLSTAMVGRAYLGLIDDSP